RFFLVTGTGTVYVDAKLSVIRHRFVRNGFHEDLTILNHDDEPLKLTIRMDADCDFADLFEIKDALKKKGAYSRRVNDRTLVLAYERETFSRATTISSSQPCALDENGLTYEIQIGPHGSWRTGLDVVIGLLGEADGSEEEEPTLAWQTRRPRTNMAQNLVR